MESVMPGLHGSPNVHPVFVPFAIVLLIVALGFAVFAAIRAREDLARVARWLLYLGTAAALVTTWTGWNAMLDLEGMPGHGLVHVHMYWMFAATGLAVVSAALAWWLARKPATGATRWVIAGALAVTCGVLTLGADRGALLVFRYGIGTHEETPPEDHGEHGHGGHEAKPGGEQGHGGHEEQSHGEHK